MRTAHRAVMTVAADYFNPKMVVGCVVQHGGKILLCRRWASLHTHAWHVLVAAAHALAVPLAAAHALVNSLYTVSLCSTALSGTCQHLTHARQQHKPVAAGHLIISSTLVIRVC
jgi:hypothetical protein